MRTQHTEEYTMETTKPRRYRNYCGERVFSSKLSEDDVRLIDQLLAEDEISLRDIAKKFDVSQTCVWNIARGNTWKHITGVQS